jgi:hypothetical protein
MVSEGTRIKVCSVFQRYLLLYTLPIFRSSIRKSEKSLKPCRAAHPGSHVPVVPVIINRAKANSEF